MNTVNPRVFKVEDLAAIGRLPLLSALTAEDLAQVTAKAELHRHARGEVVFRQGEEAPGLHLLLEGEVGLTGRAEDGDETVVEILKPGEIFIAAAVLTGKPYLMSAVVLKPARILMLPAERLRADLRRSPDLAFAMLISLAEHFRMLVREVKDLKMKSAAQRLALYLLGLTGEREGVTAIRLAHNKALIAARVGIRPETLSRAFAQLKKYGVEMNGQAVSITDVGALRGFCHQGAEQT